MNLNRRANRPKIHDQRGPTGQYEEASCIASIARFRHHVVVHNAVCSRFGRAIGVTN